MLWDDVHDVRRHQCPYLLKFVDVDLVVNAEYRKDTIKMIFTKVRRRSVTSLLVVNLRLHTGTLNFTIKTNNR